MSHIKSLNAPRTWRIPKKETKFTARPNPGAHTYEMGMALVTALKRIGIARNQRETDYILKNKKLLVDGKQRYSRRFQVGLMDVVSIGEESYRLIMTPKGLEFREAKDAKIKPVKITGKRSVKGGKTQINTMDGRNLLVDKGDYKVADTLLIEIPSQKIKNHLEFKKGATVLLIKGRHAGEIAEIEDIQTKTITFKKNGELFETKKDYAFVMGKPVIQHYE